MNCEICLFYAYCTSKLDFYILDTPVSSRLIIEQEFSECLNISTEVEHSIPSQVLKHDLYMFCGFIS